MRSCVVTLEKCEKKDLIRVVRDNTGRVFVDDTGRANGRGAYLKKDIDISELTLQEDEVEYVKWLSVDEINILIDNNEFREGNIKSFNYLINNKDNL
mgnify:CR=1 FL=1